MSRIGASADERAALGGFHDKAWCDQGHVVSIHARACPQCQNTMAVIASDLLEQLNLGLLEALEGEPLIGRAHDAAEFPMTREEQLADAMEIRR